MTNERYNGWTNYETWNVALWIDNDYELQRNFAALAQELVDDAAECGVEPDRVELADAIKDTIEASAPTPRGSLYDDLLSHALGRVDWREIADHYLADVMPTSADSDEE